MLKKTFFAFTQKEKIVFFVSLAIAFVSATALVAIFITKSTKVVPAAGGEYHYGVLGQPAYINPVIAATDTDKSLVRLIFSNILSLADNIEALPDGRTWRIRLKEGLRWQDGVKLTSDDVIFTVQKIQDGETNSPLANSWQGAAAQRLSELEVQFSLINSYAFFHETLAGLYILPKHLYADVPASNWRLSDYNLKPLGSGPYKFDSYAKRPDGFISSYSLAAWNGFAGDKPLIENFTFEFASAHADLIKNFNSGQIDAVGGIDPENLVSVKRPYETISFRLPGYYAVFLNQNRSVPLKDPVVRKALSLVASRENLVAAALGGHGLPAVGPIPEETPYFFESSSSTATSTNFFDTALNMLDAAGWKTSTSSVRAKKIGTSIISLEFNLTVPQIGFLTHTAEILRDAWQKIGVKANIVTGSTEEITRGTIKNRDYEMLLYGNVLGHGFDLFSFWHSSQRFYPGLNLALYNSKTADALIESIRQNLDDAKRLDQFKTLQKTIIDDAPAVFLYSPDYLYVASKNLQGVESGPIAEPADIFSSASKWFLKTARVMK